VETRSGDGSVGPSLRFAAIWAPHYRARTIDRVLPRPSASADVPGRARMSLPSVDDLYSTQGNANQGGSQPMSTSTDTMRPVPWWREPTRDQWLAWWAAWVGWTLDAFDFTIFLLIMVPISKEFGVPLTAVATVFTVTLWMRLVGATASGWLSDRVGRKLRS
jgi:hypothetical protein